MKAKSSQQFDRGRQPLAGTVCGSDSLAARMTAEAGKTNPAFSPDEYAAMLDSSTSVDWVPEELRASWKKEGRREDGAKDMWGHTEGTHGVWQHQHEFDGFPMPKPAEMVSLEKETAALGPDDQPGPVAQAWLERVRTWTKVCRRSRRGAEVWQKMRRARKSVGLRQFCLIGHKRTHVTVQALTPLTNSTHPKARESPSPP